MKNNLKRFRDSIVNIGKLAYLQGYIVACDGNISLRVNHNEILITPTRLNKGDLKTADLVQVDMNGRIKAGKRKPSSEIDMHIQIYKHRPDVNGICHFHPPYATAFAVVGILPDMDTVIESAITLGKVAFIEYATPGTKELANKLVHSINDCDVFLLANHGVVTVGKDLNDAYNKMETFEHVAKISFIARHLGKINKIDTAEINKLIETGKRIRNSL